MTDQRKRKAKDPALGMDRPITAVRRPNLVGGYKAARPFAGPGKWLTGFDLDKLAAGASECFEHGSGTYHSIYVGDVNGSKLVTTRMAKSVLDAGWGMLKMLLQCKGQQAGRSVRIVSERNTTRTCSSCGSLTGPTGLAMCAVRSWVCSECGDTHEGRQCCKKHPGRGEDVPVRQRERVVFFWSADESGKSPRQVREKRAEESGMSTGLFQPEVPESDKPFIVGRARFGRITIANSDAGGAAYTDAAIDQGHRAVMELLHAEKT